MAKFDYVLIDADDTLFDFSKAEETSLKALCQKFNLEFSEEFLSKYRENNLLLWQALERGEITKKDLLNRRFLSVIDTKNEKLLSDISEYYTDCLSHCGFLFDDSEKMLKELYGKCRLYIVTNGIKSVQDARLSMSGIDKYFDGIYISEVVSFQKPSKKFFDFVFQDAGITDKEKTIILGDSLTSDMQGGRNAGITTCRLLQKGEDFSNNPLCDYEIKSLMDFPQIVL